jgi:hypothetical protein
MQSPGQGDLETKERRGDHLLPETNMKIICVEEHAIDPATDKAARPAVLGEAPYFGLMDSPAAASTPRNDHRPTMVALP